MEVDPELACGIVGNIGQLWLDDQFVDLKILVGDTVFNCHQFIMCACSKFFNVLLKSEVNGESCHQIKQVTIKSISPEIFQLVLEAVYKGQSGLTEANMIELWHAAHQLQIPVLESKCEKLVSGYLSPENFVNIYETALLLKSVNVTRAAHKFVTQNFESFKDLDFLLQQPANFIADIIGSDSLIGQSQNHVVDFILKWINYELCTKESDHVCEEETGRVCAESTIHDSSLQRNELTGNTTGSVEVIFQKPLAASEDTGQPLSRKQSLGKLLKLVKFSEVSGESLELLVDNDLVMGCKETRDIIRQAMLLVNSAPTFAESIDTEDTVVFMTKNNPQIVYAYSLDRSEIFRFCKDSKSISQIQTQHNKLLCHSLYNSKSSVYEIKVTEFPFSKRMETICYLNKIAVLVGDFCYTLSNHMYRKNIKGDGDWYPLFTPVELISSPSLTVFKDNIFYYNSTPDLNGRQNVYCFDTKSQKHWHIITCYYEDCDFVTFTLNDQLYFLYGNGVVVNLSSSVTALALPKYSEIPKSDLLWDFQFKIYGAAVHLDSLIVFGDVSSILVSEISHCKIPGLNTVKFVNLCDPLTKCHPLVIPKRLLTQQM